MGAAWLVVIGRCLRESGFMFWETLWPLVFGFGLSGAVQALVRRDALERTLGSHRPGPVARAAAYGMASSSCSYAASAVSKSLFANGADFVTSLVFLFASTNLVVELGVVLVVLIGWQFAVAEYVGGVVMIALLASLGGLWFRARDVREARAHLAAPAAHDDGRVQVVQTGTTETWWTRLRSPGAWADAAAYALADLRMLRRELLIGYGVAGVLAVAVPAGAWGVVFVHGHGSWTVLENAVVGPLIAIVSFVCSIGNVPLAAALWHGGIAFGGVVAFLFADLIAFPLLLVYRRFYGTAVMLRMLVLFWFVMTVAGLLTQLAFAATGLEPTARGHRIVPLGFAWGATTYLNIAFVFVFGALVWLARNRSRLAGGATSPVDPVCSMVLQARTAPFHASYRGVSYALCSERCKERFDADPARFAGAPAPPARDGRADPEHGATRVS